MALLPNSNGSKSLESLENKLLKPIFFLLFFFFVITQNIFPQNNQMSSYAQTGKIRIQLWSLLEQDPKLLQELSEKSNNQTNSTKKELSEDFFYQYSVNEIKNLAPFVFEGIIHGWNFSYTPYDKTRQVNEYFEFIVDGPNISKNDKNISYNNPYFQDNKLFCWVEYDLTPAMLNKMKHSKSIVFKKISGKGKGKVSEGDEGIKKAFSEALKMAVRNHGRDMEKNKPKEINGKVRITGNPRVYIDNGFYVVDLDFFVQVDKILHYQFF